jgi:hypothetical protein
MPGGTFMMTLMTHRQIYVRTVLSLYVQLPDTAPPARRRDRALADHFFDRQIPIDIVETALLLGSARRIFRRPAPPPIRSLAYFESIIAELMRYRVPAGFRHSLRFRVPAMGDVAAPGLEPPF